MTVLANLETYYPVAFSQEKGKTRSNGMVQLGGHGP